MPWGCLTKIKCLIKWFVVELVLCGSSYRLFRISLARDTFRPASLKAQLRSSSPASTCRDFLGPTMVTLPLIYHLGSELMLSLSELQLV